MLCPNCGKDVGDKPRLCDDCAPPPPIVEPEPVTPVPENLPAVNLNAQNKKPKQPPQHSTADKQNNLPKIIAFFGVLTLAIILYLVFGNGDSPAPGKGSGEASPTPTPSSSESGTPLAETTPGALSMTSPTPVSGQATVAPSGTPSSGTASPAPASTGAAPASEVSLADTKWKETLAIFDKSKSELTVAFYTEPLSTAEKASVQETGVFPAKPTRFLETITFEPGTTDFSSGAVRSMKTLYSGPEVEEGGLHFSYVLAKKELPVASALNGKIEAGSVLSFASKQSAEKSLDNGKRVKLSWDLNVKAPVLAVVEHVASASPSSTSATGTTASSSETPGTDDTNPPPPDGEAPAVPAVPEGELGNIASDEVTLNVKEAYALYYPETGSVSIGLFGQTLTDADRAAILKKKVVTSIVNGKRPSMVLALGFAKKGGEISRQALLDYSAYFYRDSSGLFFFPGNYDSKSVRRGAKELQATEFTTLTGSLSEGGALTIRTAGDNKAEQGQPKLGWNLALKLTLHAVQ